MPYYPDSYKRLDQGQVDSRLIEMGFKLVEERSSPLHSRPFFLRETMQLEKMGCEFVEETIASVCSIRSSKSSKSSESSESSEPSESSVGLDLELDQVEKTESELPKQEAAIEAPQRKSSLVPLPPLVFPTRMRAMSDHSRNTILLMDTLKRYRSEYLPTTSTRRLAERARPAVKECGEIPVLPRVGAGRLTHF